MLVQLTLDIVDGTKGDVTSSLIAKWDGAYDCGCRYEDPYEIAVSGNLPRDKVQLENHAESGTLNEFDPACRVTIVELLFEAAPLKFELPCPQ